MKELIKYRKFEHRNNKEDTMLFNNLTKVKRTCDFCGHTIPIVNAERTICNHCGHWVYKNDYLKFQYKLKETMINQRKKEKNGK